MKRRVAIGFGLLFSLASTAHAEQYLGSLAVSADGSKVAAAVLQRSSGADRIVVWDVKSGKQKWSATPAASPTQLAFSPDGSLLAYATALPHDKVRLISAQDGKPVRELERGGMSLAFSPDGKVIATQDEDLQLWDVATGRLLESRIGGSNQRPIDLAVRNDRVVWFSEGILASTRNGQKFPTKSRFGSAVMPLSPDGKYLAAYDNGLMLIDAATGEATPKLPMFDEDTYGDPADAATFAGPNRIGYAFKKGILWFSVPDLKPVATWTKDFHKVKATAASKDGRIVAVAMDTTVAIVDGKSVDGKILAMLEP